MKDKTTIEVLGQLDQNWADWFEGMDIINKGDTTLISGTIKDEAFLYGILNKLRDLNLKLISVNQSNDNNNH